MRAWGSCEQTVNLQDCWWALFSYTIFFELLLLAMRQPCANFISVAFSFRLPGELAHAFLAAGVDRAGCLC